MKIVDINGSVSEHAVWLAKEYDNQLGFGWNPFHHYLEYAKEHNLVVVYGSGWDSVSVSVNGEEWNDSIEFPIEEGGEFYINNTGKMHTTRCTDGTFKPIEDKPSSDFKKITCKYVGKKNVHLEWKISSEIPHVVWRQPNDENRIQSYCIIFCLDDIKPSL